MENQPQNHEFENKPENFDPPSGMVKNISCTPDMDI